MTGLFSWSQPWTTCSSTSATLRQRCCARLRALASAAQPAAVPPGYVLVPDAENMTDAQAEAIAEQANCCGGTAYDIYCAALAAAPKAASEDWGALDSLGWQRVVCPACGSDMAQAAPKAAPVPAAVAGPSDEMVLAAARVLSPSLFLHGLEPLPKDGPNTALRMRQEAALARCMLDAAFAAARAANEGGTP